MINTRMFQTFLFTISDIQNWCNLAANRTVETLDFIATTHMLFCAIVLLSFFRYDWMNKYTHMN